MKINGKRTRQKILEAALRVFSRRGFFETRVDDIARAAGVAKGTIYLYFKDKPSLYSGIIDEHFTGAVRFLKETEMRPISNSKKLLAIAEDWLDYMLKYKHHFPMFTMENVDMTRKILRGIHETVFGRLAEIIDNIARIIAAGTAAGEFRRVDPRVGAMYFLNTIRTVFQTCTMLPECQEPKKQMIEMLFHGLKKEKR